MVIPVIVVIPVVVIAPVIPVIVPVEPILQIIFYIFQIIFHTIDGVVHSLGSSSPAVIPAVIHSVQLIVNNVKLSCERIILASALAGRNIPSGILDLFMDLLDLLPVFFQLI